MEKQISIEKVYLELRKLEKTLQEKGIINNQTKMNIPETALLSEASLKESWLSEEDEKAFAYLQ